MSNVSLENEDWSFAESKRSETLWGPHGYHRYPAKFIPQLVRRVIDHLAEPGDLVGDIFLGSGTTGVEALRAGCKFYGSDINEVANLISRAKCIPVEPTLLASIWDDLSNSLELFPSVSRRRLTAKETGLILSIKIGRATDEERFVYWFTEQHRNILSNLLEAILEIEDQQAQLFLLCSFSNILRRCSIWLSGSTKPQKDLTKTLADPVEEFSKHTRNMIRRNDLYWLELQQSGLSPDSVVNQCRIRQDDARKISVDEEDLDLLITSPPYATCYQYSDIHQLTQLWFEKYEIIQNDRTKNNWIGSKNISNREQVFDETSFAIGCDEVDDALQRLKKLAKDTRRSEIMYEVRALWYYFKDMQDAVIQMARIIKPDKHLVLVIGDSKKRGVVIPTTAALKDIALSNGLELTHCIKREVPGRVLVMTRDRKTGRFSSTAKSDTQAYPEEDILVFRKT